MTDDYAVAAVPRPTVAVEGSRSRFPVRRIFCVGRNYPEHVREMGGTAGRTPPIFFTKPADAVFASGGVVPYPSHTNNLHHEVELVVALAAGGRELSAQAAPALVFGYSVGVDLTRRDVQHAAKEAGNPWDAAKGFDHSAPVAPIVPAAGRAHPAKGRIWLEVNGTLRQQGDILEMVWSVPEMIAELSGWFELKAGDLIFTGTPSGVGPLVPGDRVRGGVDGVATIEFSVGPR